jgi:hypothetical protein
MNELSSLVSEYLAFRAARGFQPNPKLRRLLTQFVDALPPGRFDGQLFTQEQALTWAHAPVGAAPAWLADRLSMVRQFAVYLAGSGLPVGVPGTRLGPSGSRRATPYLFTDTDVQAVMRRPMRCSPRCARPRRRRWSGCWRSPGCGLVRRCGSPSLTSIWTRASS